MLAVFSSGQMISEVLYLVRRGKRLSPRQFGSWILRSLAFLSYLDK